MENFQKLLQFIQPWASVYERAELTYVALKGVNPTKDSRCVLAARLTLLRSPEFEIQEESIETPHLVVGRIGIPFTLAELRGMNDQARSGEIRIQEGLTFQGEGTNRQFNSTFHPYAFDYTTAHPTFVRPAVQLNGVNMGQLLPPLGIDEQALQWELMALDKPFGSIKAIVAFVGLQSEFPNGLGATCLRIVTTPPARMLGTSTLGNGVATIQIEAAPGLVTDNLRVGYEAYDPGENNVARAHLSLSDAEWTTFPERSITYATVDSAEAAKIDLYLSYSGAVLQVDKLVDANRYPNARVAAFSTWDYDLSVLKSLFDPNAKDPGKDLERGVNALFSLLGFSVIAVDGLLRKSHLVDLLAFTPSGRCLVIECTVGQISNNSKSDKAKQRSLQIRERMRSITLQDDEPQALVVTTLSRSVIGSQVQDALEDNIFVMCLEEIEAAFDKIASTPDPEAIFDGLTQKPLSPFMSRSAIF